MSNAQRLHDVLKVEGYNIPVEALDLAMKEANVGITIDMAGFEITPELIDPVKDLLIETLSNRAADLAAGLKPFADCVFNDNGDVTVEMHHAKYDDFVRAYFLYRGEKLAPTSVTETDKRPKECRFRLQDEGKSYPRSGCTACGKTIFTGLGKECSHAR